MCGETSKKEFCPVLPGFTVDRFSPLMIWDQLEQVRNTGGCSQLQVFENKEKRHFFQKSRLT